MLKRTLETFGIFDVMVKLKESFFCFRYDQVWSKFSLCVDRVMEGLIIDKEKNNSSVSQKKRFKKFQLDQKMVEQRVQCCNLSTLLVSCIVAIWLVVPSLLRRSEVLLCFQQVIGSAVDKYRIPQIDILLKDSDKLMFGGHEVRVIVTSVLNVLFGVD